MKLTLKGYFFFLKGYFSFFVNFFSKRKEGEKKSKVNKSVLKVSHTRMTQKLLTGFCCFSLEKTTIENFGSSQILFAHDEQKSRKPKIPELAGFFFLNDKNKEIKERERFFS